MPTTPPSVLLADLLWPALCLNLWLATHAVDMRSRSICKHALVLKGAVLQLTVQRRASASVVACSSAFSLQVPHPPGQQRLPLLRSLFIAGPHL